MSPTAASNSTTASPSEASTGIIQERCLWNFAIDFTTKGWAAGKNMGDGGHSIFSSLPDHWTVKVCGLDALPLGVTTPTLPVTPPKVTFFVPANPPPTICTCEPTDPLEGSRLVILGRMCALCSVSIWSPVASVTLTGPSIAPLGTNAVRKVSDPGWNCAATEPKFTAIAPLRPCPRMLTGWSRMTHQLQHKLMCMFTVGRVRL